MFVLACTFDKNRSGTAGNRLKTIPHILNGSVGIIVSIITHDNMGFMGDIVSGKYQLINYTFVSLAQQRRLSNYSNICVNSENSCAYMRFLM